MIMGGLIYSSTAVHWQDGKQYRTRYYAMYYIPGEHAGLGNHFQNTRLACALVAHDDDLDGDGP
jgi:hypothetical protein